MCPKSLWLIRTFKIISKISTCERREIRTDSQRLFLFCLLCIEVSYRDFIGIPVVSVPNVNVCRQRFISLGIVISMIQLQCSVPELKNKRTTVREKLWVYIKLFIRLYYKKRFTSQQLLSILFSIKNVFIVKSNKCRLNCKVSQLLREKKAILNH